MFPVVFGWSRAVINYKFSVWLKRQTVFLVLWLRVEGLCWGFSCVCLLAFWVASFFSPICGTDEAKRKPKGTHHHVFPQVPSSVLQPASLLLSSFQSLLMLSFM